MEVAADRSGGEPVTPATTTEDDSRVRLNITLYGATVLLACVAVFLGIVLNRSDVDLPFTGGDADTAQGVGEDVGRGVVTAVKEADSEDQERTAAQIDAATAMVEAMVNLDHKDADATVEAVQGLATGDFLKQYNSAAADVKKLAVEAQSTMVARVVWTGLVAGDKDSATVIVATSGTVSNKSTGFKERANNYRIQVALVLDKGKWLTQDLQFVELG